MLLSSVSVVSLRGFCHSQPLPSNSNQETKAHLFLHVFFSQTCPSKIMWYRLLNDYLIQRYFYFHPWSWHRLQLLIALVFFSFLMIALLRIVCLAWMNIFLCIVGLSFKNLSTLNLPAFEYLAINLVSLLFMSLYFLRIWVMKWHLHCNGCSGFIYSFIQEMLLYTF